MSSGLASRSLRFVFLFGYQTMLSSRRSRSCLSPPPLLFRPQTKHLPADETPPLDHKGLFPFFISTDNSCRRSRSRLLLFHFSPQTKPCSAIIKVCFPFLIWNDILSRRSRSHLLLFYSRPQTTPPRNHKVCFPFLMSNDTHNLLFPTPSPGIAESLNGPQTPIACRGLVEEIGGKGKR